ncbi:MAG: ankyrin repeat domain-containing protein [Anaerolineae bacterium]|nr:ankyrin repeat domain-containing protein [Anaerolineae bacterium]MDQ7037561.1 ankyrin repeat domain-containing protein [Anaerolineae bacterium]
MAQERPPALPLELVNEFVRVAHGDFAKVKALLEETPALLNATWDWGAGDFETALGAAAHTGSRDIAHHLIDKGARIDLFAAAMLGKLDVVKAILTAFPDARNSRGAHGIPLVVHAQQGGEEAQAVLEYLQSLAEA